jgi:hypothetical protein
VTDALSRARQAFKSLLDLLSIVGPILCLVDCVVIPLVLVAAPFIGWQQVVAGLNEQAALFLMLAICVPASLPALLRHRNKQVMYLLAAGFGFVFLAGVLAPLTGEWLHASISAVGCFFLIKANRDSRHLESCCSQSH